MEPTTQPTDPLLNDLGKPKRRRRWWLVVPLLILLGLAMSGWLILRRGGPPPYEFLKGMEMIRDVEWIDSYPPDQDEWVSSVQYRNALSLQEVSERAKKELVVLGFIWDKKPGTPLAFLNSSRKILIFVDRDQGGTYVLIRRTGKANVLHRVRIWLRKRFTSGDPSEFNSPADNH